VGQRQVWSWLIDDLLGPDDLGDPDDNVEGNRGWADRQYVTDVFSRYASPPAGSVLFGISKADPPILVSLGVVDAVGGVSTAKVRATVGSLLHVYADDASKLTDNDQELLGATPLHPLQLSPVTAENVLVRLSGSVPELGPWLSEISALSTRIDGETGLRLREERDAIQTGIALSGIALPSNAFSANQVLSNNVRATSYLNVAVFEDNEDDLLFSDLRKFDKIGAMEDLSASSSRFTDGDFELTISNVNRKPLEHSLGVDLLYWDQTANSYTLIQYKRLSRDPEWTKESDNEWVYKKKSDLVKQLKKMRSIKTAGSDVAADWRIVGNPFWFKFVRTDAFNPRDRRVLKGMYVPSDYIERGIEHGWFNSGVRGGFALGFANTKYMTRNTFIDLVRKGLSGSTTGGSEQIASVIAGLAPTSDLVVVRKSSRSK